MQRQIVSADGANIWAEQIGNPTKPAVVFIHGFGLCSIAFEKQFADVSLQANLHMVRYDLRGHGRSAQPDTEDRFTSKTMAEDFQAVCQAFSLHRPFLGTWSFGGSICSDICEHLGAESISGVVLMSAFPYLAAIREVSSHHVGSTFQTLVNPAATAAELTGVIIHWGNTCVAPDYPLSIETRWLWRGIMLSQKPLTRQLLRTKKQDPTSLLAAGKSLPVLVIHGAKDIHLDVHKMRRFADEKFSLGVAEFHALPDAGHMPFYECTQETNRLVLDWIQRNV